MSTLYASFISPDDAERAAGALLDNGAENADISLLSNRRDAAGRPVAQTADEASAENSAKGGISTTTSFDVAAGTVKGTLAGIGVGVLATLAALFVPGVGLILGGGALATAIMGGTGTIIAGAAAGALTGFLKDQGVPDDIVTHYSSAFEAGGSILAIAVPSGNLSAETAEGILTKYGASNIATVNAPRVLAEGVAAPTPDPLVVQPENPAIAPVAFPQAMDVATPVVPGVPANAVVQIPAQRSTTIEEHVADEPQAEPMVEVIDPGTGTVTRRPVETTVMNPDQQISTLEPNQDLVQDTVGHFHQTVGHSTVVNEEPVVVTDPRTGEKRPGRIVEEQHAVAKDPVPLDNDGDAVVPVEGPQETVIVRDKHIEML